MEYKYGESTFNFDEMIVHTQQGWWIIKFMRSEQKLYRQANNRFQPLHPDITKAYLDYVVEKILLEEE